jgi:hypothetical protein
MVRRGISFRDLAEALERLEGEPSESVQTLINKVNRGRFSFAFFLRVARAIGMTSLDLAPVRGSGREVSARVRGRQHKSS